MGIEERYPLGHVHPSGSHWVEIVAYRRDDGRHDVYIFEAEALPSPLEARRQDEFHVFVETSESGANLDDSIPGVHTALGPGWEPVEYMRERGSRRLIGRVYDHLKARGKSGWIRSEGEDWVLVVRRKDFELASEAARPNAQ